MKSCYACENEAITRVHADFIAFPQEHNAAEIDACRFDLASFADELFADTSKQAINQEVFWYQVLELHERL